MAAVKLRIKDEYVGKVIYKTPGSGGSYVLNNLCDEQKDNVLDTDVLLQQQLTKSYPHFPYNSAKHFGQNVYDLMVSLGSGGNAQVYANVYDIVKSEYLSKDKGYTIITGSWYFHDKCDKFFIQQNKALWRANFKGERPELLETATRVGRIDIHAYLSEYLCEGGKEPQAQQSQLAFSNSKPVAAAPKQNNLNKRKRVEVVEEEEEEEEVVQDDSDYDDYEESEEEDDHRIYSTYNKRPVRKPAPKRGRY